MKETDVEKIRFNEAQIIGVLREQEAGSPTAEVCRRPGIREQTFYRWPRPRRHRALAHRLQLRQAALGARGLTPEAVRLYPTAVRLRNLISAAARPLPPATQIGYQPLRRS
ncbi:transposase [Brevundimonas intermedia]|uniref:transposase n=1 Tax=Brevundimonas intermedia TaxID=74315 RepID=UPI0022F24AEF|nr:transposase [Brevundimonas intermedia]